MVKQVDVLIVGGGLVGASLLCALKAQNFTTLMIDAKPFELKTHHAFDARTLALSLASIRILTELDVWPHAEAFATDIRAIHVSEAGNLGFSYLQDNHAPLGAVIEIADLYQAIKRTLPQDAILAPATLVDLNLEKREAQISYQGKTTRYHAKIIVAADGAYSSVRQMVGLPVNVKDYEQQAVVSVVGLKRAHQHIAYQRFTQQGTLALLPMQNARAALIWTGHQQAQAFSQASDEAALATLQRLFGYRMGRFVAIGRRVCYPLKQHSMPETVKDALVFLGNAAHTMHPVAAQGFNLSLRDVAMLAECMVNQGLTPAMLKNYNCLRQQDIKRVEVFTDSLVSIFDSSLPGMRLGRSLGLLGLETLPVLKPTLIRYAQGLGGRVSNLICGLPLKSDNHDETI